MKKRLWKKSVFVLVLLNILLAFSCTAGAASTKAKAKKAYRDYLKGKGYSTYAFIYFDNDAIPEMIARKDGAPALFTYKKQKVTAYKNSTPGRYFAVIGYYQKQGCLVQEYESNGMDPHAYTTTYWTQDGTALYNKLQKLEYRDDDGTVQSAEYAYNRKKSVKIYMGAKKLSAKTFEKKLAKITAGKKMSVIKWKTWQDTTLTLNQSTANVTVGSTLKLTATVTGVKGTVTWTSDNRKVATVTSKGKVKGKKAGMATITAQVNGVKKSCVVVVEPVETISAVSLYYPVAKHYLGKYGVIMYFYDLNSDGIMEMMIQNINVVPDEVLTEGSEYTDGLGKSRGYRGPMDVFSIKDNKVVFIESLNHAMVLYNTNQLWKIAVGYGDVIWIYGMEGYKLRLLETYSWSVDEMSEIYKNYLDFVQNGVKEYEEIRAKATIKTEQDLKAFLTTWLED